MGRRALSTVRMNELFLCFSLDLPREFARVAGVVDDASLRMYVEVRVDRICFLFFPLHEGTTTLMKEIRGARASAYNTRRLRKLRRLAKGSCNR